jgi:hypothetical protein
MDLERSREGVISPSNSVGGVQRTWRARARRSGEDSLRPSRQHHRAPR